MSIDIVVPTLGESVTEAVIAQWLKKPGEAVGKDEAVVELETDKVTLEIPAPVAGTMGPQSHAEGATVDVGAVLGQITAGAGGAAPSPPPAAASPAGTPAAAPPAATSTPAASGNDSAIAMPAAAKMLADHGMSAGDVTGTGKDGRILKQDVEAAVKAASQTSSPAAPPATTPEGQTTIAIPAFSRPESTPIPIRDREERVRMTRLRQTIARRLKDAQNNAAMLTTFNEVDMSRLMTLRNQYKDRFQKRHGGTKLGFMSFFVKACVAALKDVPSVNASIEEDTLVYKNYYDIGVAVSTPQGLVVPVVRDCDTLGFAGVEAKISELGLKGRDGKLTLAEMTGGTFTITNGGVFGSMMSTPILNPPQSGILGMHKIQDRPMAIGGKVEIRPMMYLALTYDHRIIDGKEAVTFLVRVKEGIEDPERLLLEV